MCVSHFLPLPHESTWKQNANSFQSLYNRGVGTVGGGGGHVPPQNPIAPSCYPKYKKIMLNVKQTDKGKLNVPPHEKQGPL